MPDQFSPDNNSADLSMGWLLPLLLLVLAAGLFFYFMNGSANYKTAISPQFITPATDTAVNKKPPVSPDSMKR
ncbi:MAG TPA: hypothetical protein VN958_16935 [Chitinophagaceae bacterium]|nr:hypothetical protein [Chitinophagaceae bacterium]